MFNHDLQNGSSQTDKNLGLGGVCSMRVGIFDLEHVKVIWGHSLHFPENWAVNVSAGMVLKP